MYDETVQQRSAFGLAAQCLIDVLLRALEAKGILSNQEILAIVARARKDLAVNYSETGDPLMNETAQIFLKVMEDSIKQNQFLKN